MQKIYNHTCQSIFWPIKHLNLSRHNVDIIIYKISKLFSDLRIFGRFITYSFSDQLDFKNSDIQRFSNNFSVFVFPDQNESKLVLVFEALGVGRHSGGALRQWGVPLDPGDVANGEGNGFGFWFVCYTKKTWEKTCYQIVWRCIWYYLILYICTFVCSHIWITKTSDDKGGAIPNFRSWP